MLYGPIWNDVQHTQILSLSGISIQIFHAQFRYKPFANNTILYYLHSNRLLASFNTCKQLFYFNQALKCSVSACEPLHIFFTTIFFNYLYLVIVKAARLGK